MTNYSDVRSWNPDTLDLASTLVRSRKEQILSLQDELDMSFGPVFWHGASADGARETLKGLRDRAELVVAEAAYVQNALGDAADAVIGLRHKIEELEFAAQINLYTIGPDGSINDDAPDSKDPGRRAIAETLAAHVRSIMTTAQEIDSRLTKALSSAATGTVGDNGATTLADADIVYGGDGRYRTGPPEKPLITFDEDFVYGSKDSEPADHIAKEKWLAKLRGAQTLGYMPDATGMYDHYWDNTGTLKEWDYEKAYREDSGVRTGVDSEVSHAAQAAEDIYRSSGRTDFSMTGDPSPVSTNTENWQKTIGRYQTWSHGDVLVDGNQVTMTITVEGEDHYNFNRGDTDIATGAPDDENGRFTEIGWAKPFDTHGSMTRTVTWELGDPPTSLSGEPMPDDGAIRGIDHSDRGPTPDNPRERGHPAR